ncbi:hypothetical protein T07_10427 [Trichinella nelsoni]|uniref:Uncharacterized protein n=1 Tax=Trichinella nelsoni TaxID=6336 RepID=A0A0V0SB94_9BILA|nr:hypothetical protein T07_10427 [Trichinella nelsoni]
MDNMMGKDKNEKRKARSSVDPSSSGLHGPRSSGVAAAAITVVVVVGLFDLAIKKPARLFLLYNRCHRCVRCRRGAWSSTGAHAVVVVGRSVQMHRRPCRPKTTDGNVARKPADLSSALTSSHALEERDQSPQNRQQQQQQSKNRYKSCVD